MDHIDRKILSMLEKNARATLKEIAAEVSLTSPAVSERIRRMEKEGPIAGYTVRLDPGYNRSAVRALISVYVRPDMREDLLRLLQQEYAVEECYQVTGQQSHMVKVCCADIEALDRLISRLQKLGQTNTQIILATVQGPRVALE